LEASWPWRVRPRGSQSSFIPSERQQGGVGSHQEEPWQLVFLIYSGNRFPGAEESEERYDLGFLLLCFRQYSGLPIHVTKCVLCVSLSSLGGSIHWYVLRGPGLCQPWRYSGLRVVPSAALLWALCWGELSVLEPCHCWVLWS
jgi:hypothetical protein